MKAFLKRRWFLLSCAVALVACSILDFGSPIIMSSDTNLTGAYTASGDIYFYTGDGRAIILETLLPKLRLADGLQEDGDRPPEPWIHAPAFGGVPRITLENCFYVRLPVWLPLAAVLGWLVIRELRWREKRAKATAP